jgi:DNA-binding CsgD family transcriptional regulator
LHVRIDRVVAGTVIGRDAELDFVHALVDQVVGGPAGLVLSGDPGIGKTILWHAGVEDARRRFERVLTCRGVEAEASLSFAGLSDLLGDVLEEAAPSLVAPRRRALEVALRLAEPGEGPPDPLAIGLAVHDLLQALAMQGPMLVAIDDVQWLDPASAGVLEVALRRLRKDPIGLLVTVRRAAAMPVPLGLDRSVPEQRLKLLSVGPLSLGALHHLFSHRLGLKLTRSELAQVQEASGGNPFFALELGRELARTRARPAAGRSLRVPESLRELLGGRLAQLPAEIADVLLQVSALARPTVELVATAHGDLGRVREAISAAAEDEIVELDESRVRFAHPLLGSICYERAPVWKRRAVHRALAAAVTDTEERARHLALAAEGPDAAVASELDRAAEHAASRGATAAAAELCEMAAALTADDHALSRCRRLRAAHYHRFAGDGQRAAALLEELLRELPSGVERADVLFELFSTRRGDLVRAELFEDAVAEAAGDDARSARILALQSGFHLWNTDARAALVAARSALEKAERSDDPRLVAEVIARVGTVEAYAWEISPGLLERGAEMEERLGLELDYDESPRYSLARLLMRLGEIERSRGILEELERKAAARGDESTRVMILWPLSMLEWLAGRWPLALEHARAAYELGEQGQHVHGRAWVARMKALLEAELGLVEQARISAEEGLAFTRATPNEFSQVAALGVLGRLELELGNLEAAAGHLRDLPGRLLAGGMNDPTAPVWADAIETLITVGELEQACSYLESYELHSNRIPGAFSRAGASRCRGLFAAAEGDLDGGLRTLEHALAEPERFTYPLERGRSLLCLGTLRRQALQKKVSRDALEQALAIFEGLGARLWAEKTRAELGRISGRRASGDELTETETRVATLAAEGLSNKQIASVLFMGVSTVESHLSHVYRKLGVRSRAGLATRLAIALDGGAKPVGEATQS